MKIQVPDVEFFTVIEAAKILKLSQQTIARRLGDFPGVADFGKRGTGHHKNRLLRIPRQVLIDFIAEHQHIATSN